MPEIIEYPKSVEDALARYGDLFANECQRRHFAESLTGLFVAERKTVLSIHDEFARTTDQSCLNRFMTAAPWDPETLNDRRLEELQKAPSTRYSAQGVIPIDDTLVDRHGMLIPDAGWFRDHAEERHKIAQDDLFINDVCASGKHDPLEFRLLRKQEICEALDEPFRNHTACSSGELKQGRANEWALHRLMTIGEACRAMTRETLRTTLSWATEQVTLF